jgi:hypothetical protein
MVMEQKVKTITGKTIPAKIDTICIHGDSPGADKIVAAVREGLVKAGATAAARDWFRGLASACIGTRVRPWSSARSRPSSSGRASGQKYVKVYDSFEKPINCRTCPVGHPVALKAKRSARRPRVWRA